MEKSKNQILSELYCIKAGLSAITIEKNKLENEEKKIIDIQAKVKSAKKELSKSKTNREKNDEEIDKAKSDIEFYKTYKSKTSFKDKLMEFGICLGAGVLVAIVTPIVMFVGILIYDIANGYTTADNNHFHIIKDRPEFILMGGLVGFFLALLSYSFSNRASKRRIKKIAKGEKAKREKELEKLEEISKNDDIDKKQKEIVLLNESLTNEVIAYKKVRDVSVASSKTLYSSLMAQFSDALDPRDWANIDLIIYYYETGRADTLKEALQQVDRQKQTEAIINEINSASQSICSTIDASITKLSNDMSECFSQLSKQLTIQHQETMIKLNKIDTNINTINTKVDNLTDISNVILSNVQNISSHQYLQTALLSQINSTSIDLVNNATYMLSYKTPSYID